jgi:RNA polymerase sigma-70 factor (ECF subfamily)
LAGLGVAHHRAADDRLLVARVFRQRLPRAGRFSQGSQNHPDAARQQLLEPDFTRSEPALRAVFCIEPRAFVCLPVSWVRRSLRSCGVRPPMDSPADHPADLELVRAVLRRDPKAVDALVQRLSCIPRILAILNQRMGSVLGPEDLSDLTQDTLARLWPRMQDYTGQAALETWFYGYCFNGFMNAVRKERRLESMERASALSESIPSPGQPPPRLEFDHLERGLERLDQRDMRVIRLKYFDELTFEEIGGRLEISPNTAKTCFYRGMRRLEQLLRASEEEDP